MKTDKEIIEALGGPTAVSDLLSLKKPGGPQRVQNWIKRGIPPSVKIARPDLFMRKSYLKKAA